MFEFYFSRVVFLNFLPVLLEFFLLSVVLLEGEQTLEPFVRELPLLLLLP